MTGRLPRLLLLSDCAPEAVVAGRLLLYRLLRDYDPAALTVVHGDILPSDPARRLPGVPYHVLRYRPWRLFSRLYPFWMTALHGLVYRRLGPALAVARAARAEAVLTVAEGHLWLLADAVARRLRVPLHLIAHDDWVTVTPLAPGGRPLLHRRLGRTYRRAASRMCVSPAMEEEFGHRYGVPGTVLLPSRGPDSPPPRVRLRRDRPDGFVLAYAGSIPGSGSPDLLRHAAAAARALGGRLDLYTNVPPDGLARFGLDGPGVRYAGFVTPLELAERVGATADALLLPASFAAESRVAMRLLFPSKLVEYTAVGLPVVAWGPADSAAARWAADHPDAAVVVTDPDPALFAAALRRLADDPGLGRRLAERAVAAGDRAFSHEAAVAVFHDCLRAGRPPAAPAASGGSDR